MDNDASPFGVWQPWSVHEVAMLFSSVTVPWWIAGGWALDLFLGIQTREHEDIDVQILRRDQHPIRGLLQTWDMQAAHHITHQDRGTFRGGETGPRLSFAGHRYWCLP